MNATRLDKPRSVRTKRPLKSYPERQAAARADRGRRARALRRKGDPVLAETLEGCRPGKRCGSGACSVCHARLQRHLARALHRRAQKPQQRGQQLVLITWVPGDAALPLGQLHTRDHENQVRVWKRRLTSTNLVWLVGGVDFSVNEDRDGVYASHWSPHLYGIGATADPDKLRRQLKEGCPTTDEVARPVKVTGWDGRRNALLYAFKGEFTRRISYWGERFDPRRSKSVPSRKTSKQRLLADQKLELWQHLHQIGLTRRIFSLRAQVHRDPKRVSIRLI